MEFLNFSSTLLEWYKDNKRELPWRATKDPYKIWLSEIILQQTRIQQGISYYYKFIDHYPTVQDLARAEENEVLKDWQGLGYYSRARNLHASAQLITEKYNGIFPNQYDEILQLKGVGEYTAAAIASFAFQLPYAVLDGNVFRFLSRLYDIDTPIDSTEGKKVFKTIANEILTKENPDIHNQAMMEMGAIICTPTPQCEICPVREFCLSYQRKTIKERPVKSKKTKVRNRYFTYLFYYNNDSFFLKKRMEKDIWQNLYDFPLIETETTLNSKGYEQKIAIKKDQIQSIYQTQHILSHQRLHIQILTIRSTPKNISDDWIRVTFDELIHYPLPKVIENFIKELDLTNE